MSADMGMWPNDNDRLDRAIDEVARQMTEGTPGSDFRARVIARVDAGSVLRERRRLGWVLSPLAVAALVILAVVVYRMGSPDVARPVSEPAPPTVAEQARPLPGTEQARPAPEVTQRTAAVRARHTTRAVRPARIEASEFDALVLPPLDVASIRLAALPPADSIQVDPLETIVPITLSPVGSEDQGERR